MIIKILFWILVAVDLAAVGLFFLLGLAAAGPSHTNPLSVILLMAILPGMLLLAAMATFLFAKSAILRSGAFLLAAAPLLIVILGPVIGAAYLSQFTTPTGTISSYTAGPMREVEDAIARNDAAAIRAAAAKGNINQPTRDGTNILTLALRQLKKSSGKPAVLEALLAAGANPNNAKMELPLAMAIYATPELGPEPVKLLLDAKADPNKTDDFGRPAFFAATGPRVNVEILKLLLDRGADINRKNREGKTALHAAVMDRNYPAAQFLLDRGANAAAVRENLESQARQDTSNPILQKLLTSIDTAIIKE